MAILTGPNLGIVYNWDQGTFYKTEMDANLKLIDMVSQLGVIDKDLGVEPGSPAEGDRYILPAGVAGANWAGHDTEVAVFIEAVWEFHVPLLGWSAFVQDELNVYYFNGAVWTILDTPANISDAVTALASSGTLTMDLSSGVRNYETTLTAAATLAFSNIPAAVQTEVSVKVIQDGVGGHTLTLPAGGISPNGTPPVPSSGANERDRWLFIIDETGTVEINIVGQLYA